MIDFDTNLYDGTKSILISTTTVVGGKNSFLGIAYVAIGGLCIVIGVIFTLAHLIKPRFVLHLLTMGFALTILGDSAIILTCHGTTLISRRLRPQLVATPGLALKMHEVDYDLFDENLGVCGRCEKIGIKVCTKSEPFWWSAHTFFGRRSVLINM